MKGMAIVLIVGVHLHRGWFGWQGVHVFITLSGFTLALASCADERITWTRWYRRRAVRILPAYWLTAVAGFLLTMLLPPTDRIGPSGEILSPAMLLWRDLTLTRNFDYATMFGPVNASLWYVPMLAGLYLAFPPLMAALRGAASCRAFAGIVFVAVVVEVTFRAAAVEWLDGIGVGFGGGVWPGWGSVAPPLDRLAPSVDFQLWAPFGQFPARLGEFALGMAAGVAWAKSPEKAARFMATRWPIAAGTGVWIAGCALVYPRTGWAMADLLIASGLTLALASFGHASMRHLSSVSAFLEWLGGWSFYIFLTHVLVGSAAAALALRLQLSTMPEYVALAAITVIAVAASCRVLRAADARLQRIAS